ncbi:M20 family metallopeptidase [Bacillus shivajii]|uniref:M20 metallopeptidase family protein n=1 Tax=Bacillus shivajii TaxID=1983719 RepID=UPI001CFAA440|nr:M20 family metallopeptidase [Bacillus shivajii]UCZ52741.1 M20 family metallopeptidase [Bacillus shivajii]
MKPTVKGQGEQVFQEVLEIRRHFHQHPELSGEEYETSKKVQETLDSYGIPYKTGYAKTGVLGVIEGGKPGKTVALRADMDALPIEEENTHEFVSKVTGKMHACGHDAHTAMLLGAGKILNEMKDEIPGKVLLVFQPSEEITPIGGAKPMMEDGVFDEHQPDAIFAQHVWPDLPVGQIGALPGPMMGASDRFKIVIEGAGGHASMPHQTVDAIIVANAVMTNLQTIVSRNVDPVDSAVLTIGKIEGGSRYNVIADKVVIEGTIRTYKPKTKEMVKNRFHQIVNGVTEAMDAKATIEYYDGYPATVNDPTWAEHIQQTAVSMYGTEATPEVEPSLGGEDFSRFLLKYPGAYFWLGTALPGVEKQKPLHDPEFKIDENALSYGTEFMVQVAIDALYKLQKGE